MWWAAVSATEGPAAAGEKDVLTGGKGGTARQEGKAETAKQEGKERQPKTKQPTFLFGCYAFAHILLWPCLLLLCCLHFFALLWRQTGKA